MIHLTTRETDYTINTVILTSIPTDKKLLAEKQMQVFKTTFFRLYLLSIRKNTEVNLRAADCMTHQYIFPEHSGVKGLP